MSRVKFKRTCRAENRNGFFFQAGIELGTTGKGLGSALADSIRIYGITSKDQQAAGHYCCPVESIPDFIELLNEHSHSHIQLSTEELKTLVAALPSNSLLSQRFIELIDKREGA